MNDSDSERSIVEWFGRLAEPSKTGIFLGNHAADCPESLNPATCVRWARDAAFTASMAQEHAEGDEDHKRAEFWDAVCRFLMRKSGQPIDEVPDPLKEKDHSDYLRRIEEDLTGAEQEKLRNDHQMSTDSG